MAVKRSEVDPLKRLEEMEAAALKGGGYQRVDRPPMAPSGLWEDWVVVFYGLAPFHSACRSAGSLS